MRLASSLPAPLRAVRVALPDRLGARPAVERIKMDFGKDPPRFRRRGIPCRLQPLKIDVGF